MQLAPSTIAELYKSRWQIEIYFRNLKQLLRIKSFIGTSRNAVEISDMERFNNDVSTVLAKAYCLL